MRIPERISSYWRGTREEIEHRQKAQNLKARTKRWQNVPDSVKQEIEDHESIARRLTRRKFLSAIALGAPAAVALWAADRFWLLDNDADPELSDSAPSSNPEPTYTLEQWRELPPKERLSRLWNNKSPEIQDFDKLAETSLASAQFYASQVPSNFTPEELTARTIFVKSQQEYLDLAWEHGNIVIYDQTTSDEAKKVFGNATKAFTANDNKDVYLNLEAIHNDIEEGIRTNPEFAQLARRSNAFLKYVNYLLLHEFGHVNQSSKVKVLENPVTLEFENAALDITEMDGINFKMILKQDDVISSRVIRTDEALIDLQAQVLTQSAGNDLRIANSYDTGRLWTSELNTTVQINPGELAKYIIGELPLEDLLIKWGTIMIPGGFNSDPKEQRLEKGIKVLGIIGLVSSGKVDIDSAYNNIISILSPQLPPVQTIPLGVTPTPTPSR